MSTEEFGKIAVSTFDQSLRYFNEGVPDINSTLSLVDLAYVKPVAEKITDIYSAADELITENPSVYNSNKAHLNKLRIHLKSMFLNFG